MRRATALCAVALGLGACARREQTATTRTTVIDSASSADSPVVQRQDPMTPDTLPPIVIESPPQGARVHDPIDARGTADVFEARLGLRLEDARGTVLADTMIQATCGTGCRGAWQASLRIPAASAQTPGPLVLEAWAPSARDGSAAFVTRVRLVR